MWRQAIGMFTDRSLEVTELVDAHPKLTAKLVESTGRQAEWSSIITRHVLMLERIGESPGPTLSTVHGARVRSLWHRPRMQILVHGARAVAHLGRLETHAGNDLKQATLELELAARRLELWHSVLDRH